MMPKKSKYRIVPTTNEIFGACWALKEGEIVIGTFISKKHAEVKKGLLEKQTKEDFPFADKLRDIFRSDFEMFIVYYYGDILKINDIEMKRYPSSINLNNYNSDIKNILGKKSI